MSIDETLDANKLGHATSLTYLSKKVSPFTFKNCLVVDNGSVSLWAWDENQNSEESSSKINSDFKSDGMWVCLDDVFCKSIHGQINYPSADEHVICLNSTVKGTIIGVYCQCDSGSLDISCKVNGSAVVGIDSITVSNVKSLSSPSSVKSISTGDKISIEITSVSSAQKFYFSLLII